MRYIAILACLLMSGCDGSIMHSQSRQARAEADLAESRAKIAQQYQQCLARYENDPEKLKSVCVVYKQEFPQSGVAEWVWLLDSNSGADYVDPTTIRRSDNLVKMRALSDFKTVQNAGGYSFLSVKSDNEFDCTEGRGRFLEMRFFSGHMGSGDLVYRAGASNWIPVGYVVAKTMWKYACGK